MFSGLKHVHNELSDAQILSKPNIVGDEYISACEKCLARRQKVTKFSMQYEIVQALVLDLSNLDGPSYATGEVNLLKDADKNTLDYILAFTKKHFSIRDNDRNYIETRFNVNGKNPVIGRDYILAKNLERTKRISETIKKKHKDEARINKGIKL